MTHTDKATLDRACALMVAEASKPIVPLDDPVGTLRTLIDFARQLPPEVTATVSLTDLARGAHNVELSVSGPREELVRLGYCSPEAAPRTDPAALLALLDRLLHPRQTIIPLAHDDDRYPLACARATGWTIHRHVRPDERSPRVHLHLSGAWGRGTEETAEGRARVIFPSLAEALACYLVNAGPAPEEAPACSP